MTDEMKGKEEQKRRKVLAVFQVPLRLFRVTSVGVAMMILVTDSCR